MTSTQLFSLLEGDSEFVQEFVLLVRHLIGVAHSDCEGEIAKNYVVWLNF